MTTEEQLAKVSFNAIPRAVTAIEVAATGTGLNRTDALNRAIQLYAALAHVGPWTAIRLVWRERAILRRFAAKDAARLAADTEGSR